MKKNEKENLNDKKKLNLDDSDLENIHGGLYIRTDEQEKWFKEMKKRGLQVDKEDL